MMDVIVLVFLIISALVVAALLLWICLKKLNELWKTRKSLESPVVETPSQDFHHRGNVVPDAWHIDIEPDLRYHIQSRFNNFTPTSRRENNNDSRRRDFVAPPPPHIFPRQADDPPPRRGTTVLDTGYNHHIERAQPTPVYTVPVPTIHYESERRAPIPSSPAPTTVVEPVFPNAKRLQDPIQIPPSPKPLPKSKPRRKRQTEREDIIKCQIISLQDNFRSDENKHETVQRVQELLLSLGSGGEDDGTQCSLIIGVDATPVTQAGYCVNLVDKSLQYYVIKRQDLPWILHDEKDTSEFEMKNLMFALTVWQMKILKYKRIRVYTDNFAIIKPDDKYGARAKRYLDHFTNCEKVTLINRGSLAVNRFKNLKYFAKYIQPADDLSRWHINEAVEFLTSLYDIQKENVLGTHQQHLKRKHPSSSYATTASPSKTWYNPNANYKHLLDLANMVIECHQCGNSNCSSVLTSSLRKK